MIDVEKPVAFMLRIEMGGRTTQLYMQEDCNLNFKSHIGHKSFVCLNATVLSPQYISLWHVDLLRAGDLQFA
jgi:hypothetical protein